MLSIAFRLIPVAALLVPLLAQTPSSSPLSPRIANYQIDVGLDAETRELRGTEILTWYNRSDVPATELQFHLYLNAFRNSESTFMRESGLPSDVSAERWGFINVDRIAFAETPEEVAAQQPRELGGPASAPSDQRFPFSGSNTDLTDLIEFIQPDDSNTHDKTVFSLPLPTPLQPGQALSLEIDFTARLPSPPIARTGAHEDYFFVAQWFPKIGVFEEGAWNCHQFHANSEFYADFGRYDVRMTVPDGYVLGATGQQVDVVQNEDRTTTYTYRAEDVHDFAWTASPDFLVFEGQAQDVAIRALVQPDHAAQGPRHVEAARIAVEYFQDNYGDYPFPNLTVVDPRRGAQATGGMEYPTLITAGTFYGMPEGFRALEIVIIHEFGHNFWYHLLASNEFEESWLDEGINSYTEMRVLQEAFGPEGDSVDIFGLKLNMLDLHRLRYLQLPDADPTLRKSWQYFNRSSYGINSYSKPAVVLETLRNYLGAEKMNRLMRTYVERWRFKHPRTQDFITVASEVAGEDLNWYFDQAIYGRATLDYSVASVTSSEVRTVGHDLETLPESGSRGETDERPDMYRSRVKVRRVGEFHFPVHVRVRFDDGETVDEHWDGRDLWRVFSYEKTSRVEWATVDPDRLIPLDVDRTNDSRTRLPRNSGTRRATLSWMFLWQCLIDLMAP